MVDCLSLSDFLRHTINSQSGEYNKKLSIMKKIKLYKNKEYKICSCGASKILPFCDDEHDKYNADNGTNLKSIKIITQETVEVEMTSKNWKEK